MNYNRYNDRSIATAMLTTVLKLNVSPQKQPYQVVGFAFPVTSFELNCLFVVVVVVVVVVFFACFICFFVCLFVVCFACFVCLLVYLFVGFFLSFWCLGMSFAFARGQIQERPCETCVLFLGEQGNRVTI